MSLFTIDFETFWSTDYTLSKMSTEQYVRDSRFSVHMVGVKKDGGPTVVLTHERFKNILPRLNLEKHIVVCQNTAFDAFILSRVYNTIPGFMVDTMSMFRAVYPHLRASLKVISETLSIGKKGGVAGYDVVNTRGKEYLSSQEWAACAEYCKDDVELAWAAWNILKSHVPVHELQLIDLTLRMAVDPVLMLNPAPLLEELQEQQERKARLLERINAKKTTLASNTQFAALLETLGVIPPVKPSPTALKKDKDLQQRVIELKSEGLKLTPATCEEYEIPWAYAFGKSDPEFKHLLNHDNPEVVAAVEARLAVKSTIGETRAERFLGISRGGTMPVPLAYWGAATGRWSGCLTGDTKIIVYDWEKGVISKAIVDVLFDDLVWDGEEFVPHDGVKFQGLREVISYDGITGTPDHPVFAEDGSTISLSEALRTGASIMGGADPSSGAMERAKRFCAG